MTTKIPPLSNLLMIYGYKSAVDFQSHQTMTQKLGIDSDIASVVAPLAGDPEYIDNINEIGIGLLLSTSAEVTTTEESKRFIHGLTDRERIMHSIFLLRDLSRQYPDKKQLYDTQELNFRKSASPNITIDEINNYYIDVTKQYLQEYSKGNKYFTFYVDPRTKLPITWEKAQEIIRDTKKAPPINPEINIILQYLLDLTDPDRRKALIALDQRLGNATKGTAFNSPQWKKLHEYGLIVDNYPYIIKMMAKPSGN